MAPQLNVQFLDFKENTNAIFGKLREDKEFADVTLACEDGQQVDAHKVILSATSPFFQNLLQLNKHAHPVIFMRKVSSENLLAVLDFLYFGEANLPEENLETFLSLAEELKLKGLSGQTLDNIADDLDKQRVPSKSSKECQKIKKESEEGYEKKRNNKNEKHQDPFLNHSDEEAVKSLMEKTKNYISNGKGKILSFICKPCGKEGRRKIIKKHIIFRHIAIPCNLCGKKFMSKNDMKSHKQIHHSGMSKSQQEHEEKLKSMMTKSQNLIPNGKKQKVYAHSCKVCGKEGNLRNMKDHIEALHMERVSLKCNFCDQTFSSRSSVKIHNERRHTDAVKHEPIYC